MLPQNRLFMKWRHLQKYWVCMMFKPDNNSVWTISIIPIFCYLRCFFSIVYRFININMVSLAHEQFSIMNFAVTFLKMLTLYMLWKLKFYQFYFMPFFAFFRSCSSRNYKLKFGTRRCPKKSKYSFYFWL